MDPDKTSSSLQARPELNLLSINTGSRSKSSSRSGSRSGSSSPGSAQGRQSYLSSVNGQRVSSPILISPGSTENFQPPSYSPRPPPLERQDTSLSLSYYYSSTGAGGPNSPIYTSRSISSSSLYSPDLLSPSGSGFGGYSGSEDGSRFIPPRPISSVAMIPSRPPSRDETHIGRERPSRSTLNAGESLTSFPANQPTSPSPLNTSEFGLAPPIDPKMHGSPTSSVRSSSTSSRKGTITKLFRQSRQASPMADDQISPSRDTGSPQRTTLSLQDGSNSHQTSSRPPSRLIPTARSVGGSDTLGSETQQTMRPQQQPASQVQNYPSFQQASSSNQSGLASRPFPNPNVLRTSPQQKPSKFERTESEGWAADIIDELAMDSDSDDDRVGDLKNQTKGPLTQKFELGNFGSKQEAPNLEPERAVQGSSWKRQKETYRNQPPAPLVNSWSTGLSTGPSGFLAEDESSPVSPKSEYYRSATSSPQTSIVQLKGLADKQEQAETSVLDTEEKGPDEVTDITPRIQQVSQMDGAPRNSTPSREPSTTLSWDESNLQSPRTKKDERNLFQIKTESDAEVEAETEEYESESSFDDGTQPLRRQRQSTEYWDPITSPEMDPWFNENRESPKPEARVITENIEIPSLSQQANGPTEDVVGSLSRTSGLSAARERAARAKTAYLASLPTAADANTSATEPASRLIPTVQLHPSSSVEAQLTTSPTSGKTDPKSHGLRDPATSTILDNSPHDLSLSSSTSSSSSMENPMGGMRRTFSRASGLSSSIGGPVRLDLQAEADIHEEEETRGRLNKSLEVDMRSSRTPSPKTPSLESSGRQYNHSKQLSTATIRPSSPPPTLPLIPDLLSRPADSMSASMCTISPSKSTPAQEENARHSLSHALTLEELTAAVDRAINDTDDPPNFALRTDFGVHSDSQEHSSETDGNATARRVNRSDSTTSEASTWGDHAPPLTISIDQHDTSGQLDQDLDYVLVESPSFPPPGETYVPGELVNLQRRPSHRTARSTSSRNAPVDPSLSVSSSTLSDLPSNTSGGPELNSKAHHQQPISSAPFTDPLDLTSTKNVVTNLRQPLEPVHINNHSTSHASQSGTGQRARSSNKPYVFAPVGQWPKAMMFSDVKRVKNSGDRASMYARKINELIGTDTGLGEWVRIIGGHRGQINNAGLSGQLQPDEYLTNRKVSAASAVSEEAFPLRSSGPSFQVQQIRNVSPPSGGPPPNLPYPQLAQGIGIRSSPSIMSLKTMSSRPSMSSSIANVAQGSGTFFQALGRRGSASAGSSGGGSGGGMKNVMGGRTKSPPGVVIEDTSQRYEGRNSVSPMKGLIGNSSKAGSQKLGGPRSRNLSRTPSISNTTNPNYTSSIPPRRSVDLDHQTQNRHVLFPIPQRTSLSDIPPPRPASLDYSNDVDFDKNLREMVAILQEEDRNVLAGYLKRANGSIPNAIGSFLEDQSRRSVI